MRLAVFDDTTLNTSSVYSTDGTLNEETNDNDLDPKLNGRAKLFCVGIGKVPMSYILTMWI